METDLNNLKEIPHHKQQELCSTRPAYRQGRKLTAVKVYTVVSESRHLFVYGVPKINLRTELKSLFNKYGQILNIHVVSDLQVEMFTECFHVQYERIQSARIAKRLVDNRSFYGGLLHVCYAPEQESLEETESKLQQREKDVLTRLFRYNKEDIQKKEFLSSSPSEKELECKVPKRKIDDIETVPPLYSADDPILLSNRKLRKDCFDRSICKYISQSFDANGGPIMDSRKQNFNKMVNSKKFIPLPLRNKEVTENYDEKFIGPQLPTSYTDSSKTNNEVYVENQNLIGPQMPSSVNFITN